MARHHVPVGNHRIPLVSGLSNSTGPGRPTVAGAVDASDVGCLPRGALDPGPDLVVVVPLVGGLPDEGLLDGLVDGARAQRQLASRPVALVHMVLVGHAWQVAGRT